MEKGRFIQSRHNLLMNSQASETRSSPSCMHLTLHFHLQSISLHNKYIVVVSQSRKECFSVKDSRVVVKEESVGYLKYLSLCAMLTPKKRLNKDGRT